MIAEAICVGQEGTKAFRAWRLSSGCVARSLICLLNVSFGRSGQTVRREASVGNSGDSEHVWRTEGVPRSVLLPKPFETAQLIRAVRKACEVPER
ncbi:hypothetical protein DJ018_10910 [Phenylobacterium deserti]|uniref:Response regulatory domain-containing protein n=1 Tax=Phenylobacterium deserti TaxID=1914756 RepID=A0A328AIM3_9CAUL|nr:hypothetical protein DJ018_10910 [Phenylobacterium deserti]